MEYDANGKNVFVLDGQGNGLGHMAASSCSSPQVIDRWLLRARLVYHNPATYLNRPVTHAVECQLRKYYHHNSAGVYRSCL